MIRKEAEFKGTWGKEPESVGGGGEWVRLAAYSQTKSNLVHLHRVSSLSAAAGQQCQFG